MQLINDSGVLAVRAESYSLSVAADRPFVYLDDASGRRVAELFVLSSVHPLHGRDDTVAIGAWEAQVGPEEIVLSLQAQSSVWQGKTYRLRCRPERWSYEVEVQGQGQLAEACYFGGYYSGQPRWGSGFFWSGQHFVQGFNPEPNTDEITYFSPLAGAVIDLLGVPLPGKGHWFYTPPPFCFAFQLQQGWLALGVEARPGTNRFTEYRYHAQQGFHLSLSYEGYTAVDGRYTLPAIGFDFAVDELSALRAHVTALQAAGAVNIPPQPRPPDWWYEPIFCGWGAQCHVATTGGGRAPDHARQEQYASFLATLEQQDVSPGIVVLDDKWQASYGENAVDEQKWPDLRGFIAGQHAQGRHVLLWLKAWDPEGLPAEECITNAAGLPLAFDPSNPAFEQRLRASVRRMLSPEGYDADGFKIDFSARIPSGPGMRLHGELWGLELLRRYLHILYDEAKRVKPEALIMTHTPHPYLADVLDMIRLNDVFDMNRTHEGLGIEVNRLMALRARVAAIACPSAIIDTDNWPIRDRAIWRDYVRLQPDLGVPSLYFTSHVDTTGEPLEAEDYQLLREAWQRHRSSRQR